MTTTSEAKRIKEAEATEACKRQSREAYESKPRNADFLAEHVTVIAVQL